MELPDERNLPVHSLAGVFKHVRNSYKFFWLLALLKNIEASTAPHLFIDRLLADMVAQVWYPVTYFRLSFGKQDKLERIVRTVRAETNLDRDASYQSVRATVNDVLKHKGESMDIIKNLERYVPYRFLTPWFSSKLRGIKDHKKNRCIAELAERFFASEARLPLYRFTEQGNAIELPPRWHQYLTRHRRFIRDFCLWNLILFLQKRNPNVPNLADKLFPPQTRNLTSARQFWRSVLAENHTIDCIYTGETLTSAPYDIDHFLPWSFVSHDQIWNLVPVDSEANASKSDTLPSLSAYFDSFASLQHTALTVALEERKRKQIDEYALLFGRDKPALESFSEDEFTARLRERIAPLSQIASNMGYQHSWRYTS